MGEIARLGRMLWGRQISALELTEGYLAAAEERKELNAYVRLTPEKALAAARETDARLAAGEELSPLAGLPMGLKDNLSTRGVPTTCCSRMLEEYRPVYDAWVWENLHRQGAVLLGKTNMDEFAMGSSCETSCYGPTRHPFVPGMVPGGSSGGSACAVAAGLAVYALGSDTGGSVRQPAAFCGLVGLKPTYGAVSRYGLIAYASSLDQVGVLTSSVEDAAVVLDAISSRDDRDSTCTGLPGGPVAPHLSEFPRGLRLGVPREWLEGAQPAVARAVEQALRVWESLGAQIRLCSLPRLRQALPVYYILACAEASSNLGRYDGVRYGLRGEGETFYQMACDARSRGFGPEVRRRILLGTYVLSAGHRDACYQKAQRLRRTIARELEEQWRDCHALVGPTVPTTAFPMGFAQSDPVRTYQTDLCTVPANVAGLPALSLPCGQDERGLPVGVQLMGPQYSEGRLLQIAYGYQQAAGRGGWTCGR